MECCIVVIGVVCYGCYSCCVKQREEDPPAKVADPAVVYYMAAGIGAESVTLVADTVYAGKANERATAAVALGVAPTEIMSITQHKLEYVDGHIMAAVCVRDDCKEKCHRYSGYMREHDAERITVMRGGIEYHITLMGVNEDAHARVYGGRGEEQAHTPFKLMRVVNLPCDPPGYSAIAVDVGGAAADSVPRNAGAV